MQSSVFTVLQRVSWLIGDLKILPVLFTLCIVVGASVLITGCTTLGKHDPFAGTGSPMYKGAGPIPKGGGRRHLGKPYEIAGIKFYPKEEPNYDKVGVASWYGPKFHKRMTSNGEWFNMNDITAAHTTLPLPSYAKVTNLENGRELIVRVNDRGPFVDDRIIDLSRKSAEILDVKHNGTGEVRVQYIGPAPLDDQGWHLAAMNQELSRGTPLRQMIAQVDGTRPDPVANQYAGVPSAINTGNFFVQVAAFSDQNNAHRTQARLRNIGPVVITPVSVSIGTVYRVQMGPLADEVSAQNVLNQVVDAGHHDARLFRIALN